MMKPQLHPALELLGPRGEAELLGILAQMSASSSQVSEARFLGPLQRDTVPSSSHFSISKAWYKDFCSFQLTHEVNSTPTQAGNWLIKAKKKKKKRHRKLKLEGFWSPFRSAGCQFYTLPLPTDLRQAGQLSHFPLSKPNPLALSCSINWETLEAPVAIPELTAGLANYSALAGSFKTNAR